MYRHGRDARRVPLRDVGAPRGPLVEELRHAAHGAHVPLADRPVRRGGRGRVRDPRRHRRRDVGVGDAGRAERADGARWPRGVSRSQRRPPPEVDGALVARREPG